MKVAMFVRPGHVELQDVPVPTPGPGEVLVKLEVCGVCASDPKIVMKGHPVWKPPRVLGHEMVGQVVEINGRSHLSVGDRIAVAMYVPCGHCFYCLRGEEAMCEDFMQDMPDPGGFSEYLRLPVRIAERGVFLVPEGLPSYLATLAEPVGCVIQGIQRSRVRPGSTVLVLGDGPMGMLNAAVARLYGATTVILSGLAPERLAAARHFADIVVDINSESLEDVVRRETSGHGVDVAIAAVGQLAAVKQGFDLVRAGGTLNIFAGLPEGSKQEFDLGKIHYREVNVTGTFGAMPVHMAEALTLVASNRLDFAPVITRSFKLVDFMEAMDYSVKMQGLRSVIEIE